jgi:hypothetical protein
VTATGAGLGELRDVRADCLKAIPAESGQSDAIGLHPGRRIGQGLHGRVGAKIGNAPSPVVKQDAEGKEAEVV